LPRVTFNSELARPDVTCARPDAILKIVEEMQSMKCPRGHEFEFPAYEIINIPMGASWGSVDPVCPICHVRLYGK
jgi:hypothetical protein